MGTNWTLRQNSKARKGSDSAPENIQAAIVAVKRSLILTGKAIGHKNFGPLKQLGKNFFHCHLNNGKPTYVMIWIVESSERLITVTYVGTHEKAPY